MNGYFCPECGQHFVQKPSLEAHQRENRHAYCHSCDIVSSTKELHALHMYTLDMQSHAPAVAVPPSATQFRCCDCERDFKSEGALTHHLQHGRAHRVGKTKKQQRKQEQNEKKRKYPDQKPKRNREEKRKRYEGNQRTKCKLCERPFKNRGALNQHLNSGRHNPLSNIKCIADAKCKKYFHSPSAQLHHLESGRCRSGMTAARLKAAIAANDASRIKINTTQQRPEPNPSLTTAQIRTQALLSLPTPFITSYPFSAIPIPPSTLLKPPSLPPHPQPCPFCPPSLSRKFTPLALQHHLASKIHAPWPTSLPIRVHTGKSFRCSLRDGAATRRFSTVSGLAQYLESEAWKGGRGVFSARWGLRRGGVWGTEVVEMEAHFLRGGEGLDWGGRWGC